MDLPRNILKKDDIFFSNGVAYLSPVAPFETFGNVYLSARKSENRIFTDELVSGLPILPHDHPLRNEWLIRANTLNRFGKYLEKKDLKGITLELGCGNGWFSHFLKKKTFGQVLGMDVNIEELEQGARVFDMPALSFIYGNIFDDLFHQESFQMVVLNASAQYFPNLKELISKLIPLITPDGEIHILDTQFYADEKYALAAKQRSAEYYNRIGVPGMQTFYHHHLRSSLLEMNAVKTDILYKISNFKFQILNFLGKNPSPFPWIRIMGNL